MDLVVGGFKQAQSRFISNSFIDETLIGYCKKIKYDDNFYFRGDMDLYFRSLIDGKGVVRFNGFSLKMIATHGKGFGGLRNIGRKEIEQDNELIVKKYGYIGMRKIKQLKGKGSVY